MSKHLHLSRCRCGKVRYRDKWEEVRALHRIHLVSSYQIADSGYTKRQECRAYSCGLCKGFHLTSSDSRDSTQAA
jgi:hypothetical protein